MWIPARTLFFLSYFLILNYILLVTHQVISPLTIIWALFPGIVAAVFTHRANIRQWCSESLREYLEKRSG